MPKKILLVDDDADDRSLFCEALTDIDPDIVFHFATDGQDALNKLQDISSVPDIIFLDVNMPGKNGWYCLSKLKDNEALKKIPVIMFSTSSNGADIEKALTAGAECFFTKPDDFKELKNCLKLVVTNMDSGCPDAGALSVSPWFAISSL